MWYDGELIPDIAIKPKGNSSLNQALKEGSIRIGWKADINYYNPDANLNGVIKLNFSNGFSDPTLIREALAYEVFREIGIPASRCAFVDLWVNDDHLGVYTMVEQVDKAFIRQHFPDDNGNLYKPEMPAGFLNWTERDYERILAELGDNAINNRRNLMERMDLKTNEKNPDHSLLFRFLDIINGAPNETFVREIEQVLDVDEALRYLAVSTLLAHLDNYIAMGHNYYLYEDQGKFVILPWDLNMAFGTFNYSLNREKIINYYIDEPTGGPMAGRPLVDRLLSHQPYLDIYHHYLEELIDGPFSTDRMNSRIDELADLIRPSVMTDERKFFTNIQFEIALDMDVLGKGDGAGRNAIGLKSFVIERSNSVIAQLEGRLSSGPGDGSGNGGRPPQPRNMPPPPLSPP
ncbi:CotH kinase family protein [Chloroflexota bacterium]